MIGPADHGGRASARRPHSPDRDAGDAGRGFDARLDVLDTAALEVTLCAIAGDRVPEIARFLGMSPTTVRRRLDAALARVGCPDVAELRRRYGWPERQAA